jgi:F0F1-type ATP synthase assembly protein I
MSSEEKENYRRLALYSSLILVLPITLIGGVYVGLWADEYFGTAPLLTLVGFALGAIGAFYELVRILGLR